MESLSEARWILASSLLAPGLLTACGRFNSEDSGGPFHPDGWAAPEVHGTAAKLQELQCTSCHGEDLGGGSSVVTSNRHWN